MASRMLLEARRYIDVLRRLGTKYAFAFEKHKPMASSTTTSVRTKQTDRVGEDKNHDQIHGAGTTSSRRP